ncbi:hypothetical protein B6N42_08725 [Cutibacterium avidum]|nr:hypothetical protein B6N42_08725 [Cutibacterium avidum]PGX63740.1 hypothetical protein B6N41_10175 [Cutibacterium avidum]PGX64764.1 hypothetical protein B6N40_03150 [Cutibacterium avidum]
MKSALKWPRPHYGRKCVIGHVVSPFQFDSRLILWGQMAKCSALSEGVILVVSVVRMVSDPMRRRRL